MNNKGTLGRKLTTTQLWVIDRMSLYGKLRVDKLTGRAVVPNKHETYSTVDRRTVKKLLDLKLIQDFPMESHNTLYTLSDAGKNIAKHVNDFHSRADGTRKDI